MQKNSYTFKDFRNWTNYNDIVISFIITLFSVIAIMLLIKNSFTVWHGDATAYWDMAQQSISPQSIWWWGNTPYTYRIFISVLVHNFFNSSIFGFIFIGIFSFMLCNYLIMQISELYTNNYVTKIFMAIIFSSNYTIIFTLADICLVDLPTFACFFAIFLLFLKYINSEEFQNNALIWILFSILLLIGALAKEWILLLIPALFLFLIFNNKNKLALFLMICSIPAVLSQIFLRIIMGPYPTEIDIFSVIGPYLNLEIGAFRQIFSAFGALWLIIPFAIFYCYREKFKQNETFLFPIFGLIIGLIMSFLAAEENRYFFFSTFTFLIPAFSIYFEKIFQEIKKPLLYALISIFIISRFAICYRPDFVTRSIFIYENMPNYSYVISTVYMFGLIQILVIILFLIYGLRSNNPDKNPS